MSLLKRFFESDTLSREEYAFLYEELKADYCNAVLKATPRHMQKAQEFSLQYLFSANGFFILKCIQTLLNSGKLKPPTEEQRNSLTTVIIHE